MGDPVELDEMTLSRLVNQDERVDAKSLHHTIGPGNCAVRHGPHEHMGGLGVKIYKVPEVIVGSLCLGDFIVRLRLDRVNWSCQFLFIPGSVGWLLTEIREFDGLLDEENGDVVPDNIPVSLIGVKLDGKSSNIAHRIRAPSASLHSREAHEDRRVPRHIRQDPSVCEILCAFLELEVPKRTGTTRMHHSLGNTLVVKTVNLSKLGCRTSTTISTHTFSLEIWSSSNDGPVRFPSKLLSQLSVLLTRVPWSVVMDCFVCTLAVLGSRSTIFLFFDAVL